jgi:hypothetical protein
METLIENQKDFLTVEHSNLALAHFLKTQPVHCQRFVEPRLKQLSKILSEKTLPTHLEVSVVQAHFTNEYYKQNVYYSINGNTRKELWLLNEDLQPSTHLYATIYHAYSELDVEQIYRSIDSYNSVETKKHQIGGLCRSTDFTPESNKIRTGNFATALRRAYICCTGVNTYLETSNYSELENKKEFMYFLEEIKFMDKWIASFEKDKFKYKKFCTGNIMASMLIMGKKYGVTNPKFIEMFDALINEKVTKHDGVNGLNDGVSVVWKDIYEKNNPTGNWTKSSEGYAPIIIGQLLYCLEHYMIDQLLTIRNYQSTKGIVLKDEQSSVYYRNYIKSLNN